jgi:hypothetical protein
MLESSVADLGFSSPDLGFLARIRIRLFSFRIPDPTSYVKLGGLEKVYKIHTFVLLLTVLGVTCKF